MLVGTDTRYAAVLAALLGEMHLVSGTVFLPKATHVVDDETGLVAGVSFCAQQPWLESSMISRGHVVLALICARFYRNHSRKHVGFVILPRSPRAKLTRHA